MIEILILYVIHKREKTLYGIRKDIIELFGTYTKPSIGTIYPALQRLQKDNSISVYEKTSEGGKKSSYFSITQKGTKDFRDLFFATTSDNPSLFYPQLLTRICILDYLSVEDRKLFIAESIKKIELLQFETEKKLNNEFLELSHFHREVLETTRKSLTSLSTFMKQLKVEHDS